MDRRPLILRPATAADAPALLEIYRPYVEKTAITFEYEVPSGEDFTARIRRTMERYPWLVAEEGGELLGYAYTGAFHPRAAYSWNAETSIYLREDQHHRGLGRQLYTALEVISRKQHILRLDACIALPHGEDDEYLTSNSADFHHHMGYTQVGRFPLCGYKFDRWYDMVWMEKVLCGRSEPPLPIVPYPELGREALEHAGLTLQAY